MPYYGASNEYPQYAFVEKYEKDIPDNPSYLELGFYKYNVRKGPLSYIQSALVISNSKGLPKILRYIRTSTYQICRIEEKITRTTTFNTFMCNWTLEVRNILKILWKRGEIAPKE